MAQSRKVGAYEMVFGIEWQGQIRQRTKNPSNKWCQSIPEELGY